MACDCDARKDEVLFAKVVPDIVVVILSIMRQTLGGVFSRSTTVHDR